MSKEVVMNSQNILHLIDKSVKDMKIVVLGDQSADLPSEFGDDRIKKANNRPSYACDNTIINSQRKLMSNMCSGTGSPENFRNENLFRPYGALIKPPVESKRRGNTVNISKSADKTRLRAQILHGICCNGNRYKAGLRYEIMFSIDSWELK